MKTVKMSLVNRQGKIINTWSVPYVRRDDALDHAIDRAEQEGHAGVLWSVFNHGETQTFAFDAVDENGAAAFALAVLPYMTGNGLDVDRLLREGSSRGKGVACNGAK